MRPKTDYLDISYKKEFLFSNIPSEKKGSCLFRVAHEQWEPKLFLTRGGTGNQILAYIIKGEGVLSIDHQTTPLNSGMVFSMGPQHHNEIFTDGNRMEIIIMAGSGTLHNLFSEILGRCSFAYKLQNPLDIQRLFEAILHEAEFSNQHTNSICMNYLEILLWRISLNRIHYRNRGSQAMQTFNKCRQYIDRNYESLRSSSDIAEKCNIVTAYLCRLFKSYEKCTPGDYLIRLKLNKANTLLATTQQTVKTIAEQLAFDNPYTFSRVYKKHMGLSPLHFRQKNH